MKKKKKTVWLPPSLIEMAEEKCGHPGNPLNWNAWLLYLVVKELASKGGAIK